MKKQISMSVLAVAASAVLLPAVFAHAGTESFVNGGNNDFLTNYAGTQATTVEIISNTASDNSNNGTSKNIISRASASNRYRFIIDWDLSALTPYASQISVTGVDMVMTQYSQVNFGADVYPLVVGAFYPSNYGWTQTTATGDNYNGVSSPNVQWKDINGNATGVYPLPATSFTSLFTQSNDDPNDYMDGNPKGTQYNITDPTGAFLTEVQNWVTNPTQNAGLFVSNNGNSNNYVQYYNDVAANPVVDRPNLVLTVTSPTMTTNWTADASDIWSNSSDWSNGVASTIGATANFGATISAPRTITLDAPQVLSNINFSSPYGYTIAGTNALTIIEVNNNLAIFNVTAGSNVISAPVVMNTNTNINVSSGSSLAMTGGVNGGGVLSFTGPGALTLGAGSLTSINAAGGGSLTLAGAMAVKGPFTINTGATLVVSAAETPTLIQGDGTGILNIAGGSLVPSAQPVGTLTLAGLSMSDRGKFNVGTSNLAITYSGISPLANIESYIQAGYANGTWAGNGLTSSYITAHAGTGLGVVDTGSQVNVDITWLGDLDLDGAVSNADLSAIGVIPTTGPEAGLIGWFDGDLNYDGKINADDYSLFELGAALSNGATIAVPEPASLGLLVVAGLMLGRRRRCN